MPIIILILIEYWLLIGPSSARIARISSSAREFIRGRARIIRTIRVREMAVNPRGNAKK